MKNFKSGPGQVGERLVVRSGVVSGDPEQVGDLNGVAFEDRDTDTYAVLDIAQGNIYRMYVRNVTAYNGGEEQTYAAITVGKKVYFDVSSTMPAGVKLSTSAEDKDEAATKLWGIAMEADATATENTAYIDVMLINPAV